MVVCIAPAQSGRRQQVACVICGGPAELTVVCSGAVDSEGRQTFACNQHLLEHARRAQWVVRWADLAACASLDDARRSA